MRQIAILGASGFIGRRLVGACSRKEAADVQVSTRPKRNDMESSGGIYFICGDMHHRQILDPGTGWPAPITSAAIKELR